MGNNQGCCARERADKYEKLDANELAADHSPRPHVRIGEERGEQEDVIDVR